MKPSTPLPWQSDRIKEPRILAGNMVLARLSMHFASHKDAAYIAHAANAYPRLVAFAQAVIDYGEGADLHGMACDLLRELGEIE